MFEFSADEIEAVRLSLRVAFWAMLGSLPFGLATAMVLARGRFWGKSLLDGIVHLPLVMPPVVTGYLLLLLFGRNGPLGRFLADTFGIVFAFRWTGAALASAVMGFPLMVRAIRLSLEAVDRRLEEAASTLGAGSVYVFLLVTLPLIAPGIVAGMVLSFARSLGEFGATITFVSNIPGETRTIASAIYTLTQTPGGDAGALRLTFVSIALSLVALLAADLLARRIGPAARWRLKRCSKSISSTDSRAFELDIHFRAGRGLTALFGRSGAGKTSVVNAIAGLIRPQRGRIVIDGSVLVDTEQGVFVLDAPAPGRLRLSGRTAFPASHRPPESAVRPLVRPGRGTACGRARRRCRAARHRVRCSTAAPAGCRAARSSGSRLAGRCSPDPGSC